MFTRLKANRLALWAALLSVGIHGVIAFGLWWLSSHTVLDRNSPVEFDACVVIDDDASQLYLPSPRSSMLARSIIGRQGPSEGEAVSPPFTATVRSAPSREDSPADPPANEGSRKATGPPARANADRNGARGSGDGDASATYFGVTAKGRSVVLVIDRSLSMGLSGAFRQAKRETAACLEHLPPDAKFQVVLYNRQAEPLRVNGSTNLLCAESAIVAEVEQRIENLRAEGATDHLRALKEAIHLKPDVIFVVTDADGLTLEAVNVATRINLGKATIHCIEVATGSDDRGSTVFRHLAEANAGVYRLVNVSRKPDENSPK
jgi:hypothetical protein